jgi:hypothetical protein
VRRSTDCFTFAFVRNPWARVVSAYLNKFLSVNCTSVVVLQRLRGGRWRRWERPQTDITFREFVEFLAQHDPHKYDEHWRPQSMFLKDQRLDFLGRFENLTADFAWVQQQLGIDIPLPHHNVTDYARQDRGGEIVAHVPPDELRQRGPFPSYRWFYTPRLRDLVAQIYATDIERFGYDFG